MQHRRHPVSAGFVGAFRATICPGGRRASTGTRRRPCSAPNGQVRGSNELSAKGLGEVEQTRFPLRTSKLARPISAPVLPSRGSRCDEEEAKKNSEWVRMSKQDSMLLQEEKLALTHKQYQLRNEEWQLLNAQYARQAKLQNLSLHKKARDRKAMDAICREFERGQLEEKNEQKRRSLEAKSFAMLQMMDRKQRRAQEQAKQLLADDLARRECARLVAEEKIEKRAAEEARRLEKLETSRHLQEQARLKELSVKEDKKRERKILKEYEEMMERQEAARLAKLQEMADDQARRMALNSGAQKEKQGRDDAMAERIERHWKEKYAAEDAKFRKECLERKQRQEECNNQRAQQIDHDQELLRIQHREDARLLSLLAEKHKAGVAKDRDDAASKQAQRKENQRQLLAQIAETRARVPVDMSQTEREINLSALTSASSRG